MRQRSEKWAKLAVRGRFGMDVAAEIGGVTYTAISAPVIDRALLSDDLSVGNCISASMKVAVLTDDVIPPAASVVIKARIYDDNSASEWLTFGTFYIDKREENNGLVTLQCFDSMLKANQNCVDPSNPQDRIGWPKSMKRVVEEIAERIGVELDPRTVIKTTDPYQVAYPTNYTMQQVLGFIGACHGGNWIITPENKLRLVPIVAPPSETFDIIDYEYNKIYTDDGYKLVYQHYETGEPVANAAGGDLLNVPVVIGKITTAKRMKISRVTLARDEALGYTLGDDTGIEVRIESNPYACQAICDDLYAALNGIEYAPFTITKACYDPCTELGDWIIVGSEVRSTLYSQKITLGTDFRADAAAPGKDETSTEYPYLTEIQKLHKEDERLKAYMDDAKDEISSRIEQTYDKIILEVSGTYATKEYVSSSLTILDNAITAEVTRAMNAEEVLSGRISVTSEEIAAEVKRAKGEEETLAGRITVNANAITAEVTRATKAEGDLSSRITVTENSISLKVSKGSVSSEISAESGSVSIRSNRLTISSNNFSLSGTGSVSATGSFTTSSSTRKSVLSSGGLDMYYNDAMTGRIRGDSQARQFSGGGGSYDVMKIEVGAYGLIFTSDGTYNFAYNNGLNPNGYTERLWFGGESRFQGTMHGYKLEFDNGAVSGMSSGVYVTGNLYATDDIWCGGAKNRAVVTKSYGTVGMNSMESTVAVFSDVGSAKLDTTGTAYIFFAPDFFETIDLSHEYQVFTTQTGKGAIARIEKQEGCFIVYGDPDTTFDWIVYARQRDYVNHRMERLLIEPVEVESTENPVFYGDNIAGNRTEAFMEEFADNLDELAEEYLREYEREVYGYDD